MDNKLSKLSSEFAGYIETIEEYETKHDEIRSGIIKLNDTVYNLSNIKVDIEENNKYIHKCINAINSKLKEFMNSFV